MRKLDLPKTDWISSAGVGFCSEGYFRGVLMAQVSMSGKLTGTIDDVEALVVELERLGKSLVLPRRRIVRFSGTYAQDDIQLENLVRSLVEYGFEVQGVFTGDPIPHRWMEVLAWMVLRTSKPRVLWSANEIWYSPKVDPENPKAPIADLSYPITTRPTFLYLFGRLDYEAAEEFVAKSANAWILHA